MSCKLHGKVVIMRRTQADIDDIADYMEYIKRLEDGAHCRKLMIADYIIVVLSISVFLVALSKVI